MLLPRPARPPAASRQDCRLQDCRRQAQDSNPSLASADPDRHHTETGFHTQQHQCIAFCHNDGHRDACNMAASCRQVLMPVEACAQHGSAAQLQSWRRTHCSDDPAAPSKVMACSASRALCGTSPPALPSSVARLCSSQLHSIQAIQHIVSSHTLIPQHLLEQQHHP